MNHPDFRVSGKIFASLGYPKPGWGVVLLTSARQMEFIQQDPKAFSAVKGGWGARGATQVRLSLARRGIVESALRAAWETRASRKLRAMG